MDDEITIYMATVSATLEAVIAKVAALVKSHPSAKLDQIQGQLSAMQKTLGDLRTKIGFHPGAKTSVLRAVTSKDQDFSLFTYLSMVLRACIATLRELKEAVKFKSSGGKKGFLGGRRECTAPDPESGVYDEELHFFDLALHIGCLLVDVHRDSTAPKVHFHEVKNLLRHMSEAEVQLQSSCINIMANQSHKDDSRPASPARHEKRVLGPSLTVSASGTDFQLICLRAVAIIAHQADAAETEITQRHAGFVPMEPLVEVNTNLSLR